MSRRGTAWTGWVARMAGQARLGAALAGPAAGAGNVS